MVRTFFRAICAFVTLLALLFGLPAVLGYGTWAIALHARPRQASLTQLLTTPDNGNLFLWALVVVGWLAWLAFAVSVVVEIPAQLRGRVARRLPALGWSQRLVGGLVGAILATLPMAGGALAATGAPAPRLAVSAPLTTPDLAVAPIADEAAPQAAPVHTSPQPPHHPHYVVRETRPADTLWGIAERTLGSGERWREIAALNEGRVMDPQHRVFDAERPLQPGWKLLLPRDAHVESAPSPTASSGSSAPSAPSTSAPRDSEVTVRPGDTLSGIAERELGSATAWPQLFDANRGVAAPDGVRLTDPNLIEPGMRLTIPSPDDSDSGGLQGSQPLVPAPPSQGQGPNPSPTSGATSGPSAAPTAGGGVFTHGQSAGATPQPTSTSTSGASPDPTPAAASAAPPSAASEHGGHQSPAQFAVAAGTSVLGAVLLGTVALRRSRRRTVTPRQAPQHRASGRPPRPSLEPPLEPAVAALPPVPAPPAPGPYLPTLSPLPPQSSPSASEPGAPRVSQQSVRDLDLLGRALRSMARNVAREGRRLPPINVARVTPAHTVELHLIAPSPPVAPFRAAHASTVWWCTPDAPGLLGPEAAAVVPSPYPALVSLGETADGATVLVDLEAIRLLHVSGEPHDIAQVLRTLALELTFTPLADRVGVHVVGVAQELAAVADDRLVVHPDLEHAVAALQRRDAAVRSALVQAGAATPREARSRGLGGDEWAPEVVLCAGYPTGDLPEALGRLLDARPRGSVAVITAAPPAGTGPVARWTLPASGHGVVPGLEMGIQLQRLDDDTYHHWLRLLGADLVPPPAVNAAPPAASWPQSGPLRDALRGAPSRFPEPGEWPPSPLPGHVPAPEPLRGSFGPPHAAPSASSDESSLRRFPAPGAAQPRALGNHAPTDVAGGTAPSEAAARLSSRFPPPGAPPRPAPDTRHGPASAGAGPHAEPSPGGDPRLSSRSPAPGVPGVPDRRAVSGPTSQGVESAAPRPGSRFPAPGLPGQPPVSRFPAPGAGVGETGRPVRGVPDRRAVSGSASQGVESSASRSDSRFPASGGTPSTRGSEQTVSAAGASGELLPSAGELPPSVLRFPGAGTPRAGRPALPGAPVESGRGEGIGPGPGEPPPQSAHGAAFGGPAPRGGEVPPQIARFPAAGAPPVRGGFAPQAPAAGMPSLPQTTGAYAPSRDLPVADDPRVPFPASSHPPTDPWILALLGTPPAGVELGQAQLRVLGPVELVGAMGPVEAVWRAGLVEVAARRELGPAQGAYASADAIGRLREWLGDGPGGRPVNLRCDWDDFQALRARGLANSGRNGDTALARALALVRGAPFAEAAYPWAEALRSGMTAAVVDVAHELTLRRLCARDHRGAEAAVRRGLVAEPDAELLLRDLVLVHADAGDGPQLQRTVARLETKAARTGVPPEPETAALLDELRSPEIDPLSRR